jgi:hypothetical protein
MESSQTQPAPGGQQAPAGWYPNPNGAGQRYWDGQRWTEHVSGDQAPGQAPGTTAPAAPGAMVKDPRNDTLAIVGYIASLVPLIGLIIGLVLRSRRDPRGNTVLIVTGVVFVLYLIAASSGSG